MNDKMDFLQQNAPCYLYEKNLIKERCHTLLDAMPEVDFLYSVKTNPFAPVLKTVAEQGFGADVASANEVLLAQRAGIRMIKFIIPRRAKPYRIYRRRGANARLLRTAFPNLTVWSSVRQRKTIGSLSAFALIRISP